MIKNKSPNKEKRKNLSRKTVCVNIIISGLLLALATSCGPIGLILEEEKSGDSHKTLGTFIPSQERSADIGVVPVDVLDSFFTDEGEYALESDERELLRIAMYRRYDRGFYEPEAPGVITAELQKKLKAAEEEGVTYSDIQDEFIADARRGMKIMPDRVLSNLRQVAGNSIVLTVETIRRKDEFEAVGMDMKLMEDSLERMRKLRKMVIDEQNRRKNI